MFHLALFSSAEAALPPGTATVLTVFGSCALRAPTLAQRITDHAERRERPRSAWDNLLGRGQSLFVTAFGSTEILLPSLVEEFAALQDLAARAREQRQQLRDLALDLARTQDCGLRLSTFTLFGGCQVRRPSHKREVAALERAQQCGDIDARMRAALDRLVGRSEPELVRGLTGLALA